jgi:hypothetical protein
MLSTPSSPGEFSRRIFLRKFAIATGSFSLPASLTDRKSLPPHPGKALPSHQSSLAFIHLLASPLSRRESPSSHLSLSRIPANLLLARSLSFHGDTFCVCRLVNPFSTFNDFHLFFPASVFEIWTLLFPLRGVYGRLTAARRQAAPAASPSCQFQVGIRG